MKGKIVTASIVIFRISSVLFFFGTLGYVFAMLIIPADPGPAGVLSKWLVSLGTLAVGILFSLFCYTYSDVLKMLAGLDEKFHPRAGSG